MEYSKAFQLIDTYSRNDLNCFVAEFFPDRKHRGFHLLCFRPTNAVKMAHVYACEYLSIADDDLSFAEAQQALAPMLEAPLRRELQRFISSLIPEA